MAPLQVQVEAVLMRATKANIKHVSGSCEDILDLLYPLQIAQLLCDEIVKLVDSCFVCEDQLRIGQVLVLAPEVG